MLNSKHSRWHTASDESGKQVMQGATEVSDSNGLKTGNGSVDDILGFSGTPLRVKHVMNEDVIVSPLGETVFAAAKKIRQ